MSYVQGFWGEPYQTRYWTELREGGGVRDGLRDEHARDCDSRQEVACKSVDDNDAISIVQDMIATDVQRQRVLGYPRR